MSQSSTATRARTRLADAMFPGEKITSYPARSHTDPAKGIEAVRRGEVELASLPFMSNWNQHVSDKYALQRKEYFDRGNPDDCQRLVRAHIEAYKNGNKKVETELAAYREVEIISDVLATPWALAAFQQVNLNPDELLMARRPRSRNLQHFQVRSIGMDGGPRLETWKTMQSAEAFGMDMVTTDRVGWPLLDLQMGNIAVGDQVNESLKYDMAMKIDSMAKANIDAAQCNSGLRATLNLHPSIVAANIPDTNYLNLNGVDDPGVLSIGKLKTILMHIAQFGSAGGADLPISIKTIMYSPQNIRDSWDFTNLVSCFEGSGTVQPHDTVPTAVRESIFNTGVMSSAWGMSWSWMPNAQLDKGRMYILTDQPLGWMLTKTELDKVFTWGPEVSPDYALKNRSETMMRKALRFWFPNEWRYRIVIVDL